MSQESIELIWLFACLLMVPFAILYTIGVYKIISMLRTNYPEVYESLGSFTPVKNNTVSNSAKVVRFILKGEYKHIKNNDLNNVGDQTRILLIIALGLSLFAFLFAIVIAYIL